MRAQARIQGRVPVIDFERRRMVTGRVVTSVSATPSGATTYTVTSGDWTADGSLYYVDIVHSLRGVAYVVQLNDDHTGEDIWPERINRRIDLDTCRIWLAHDPPPASITVIIA